MKEIRVERRIEAPIEGVFEALSDHAQYTRFRGIQRAELERPGDSEPNGLGAVRRIHSGPLQFTEEITAFERPTRMDYRIVKLNIPFNHEGGSIRLSERDGATEVLWTSTFSIPIPLLGSPLAALSAAVLGNGFKQMLDRCGEIAVAGTAAPQPA
jgi:uncharacterized protein YndB with AHSA1/START domain